MPQLNLKSLFESGAHFGHRVRFWHPSNQPYVYGRHGGIHIINLDRTLEAFDRALKFLAAQATDNRKVLFVCTKRVAQGWLGRAARRCGMPYVDNRWLGGTLTNFLTIRQSIERLDKVEKMLEDESLSRVYVKKEILRMRKSHQKLLRAFGGIRHMTNLPDALFVIDVGYERIAVDEAKKLGIPVVGVVDTNHSSENIDYPIPANDDSMSAIQVYLEAVSETIRAAYPGALPELDDADKEPWPEIRGKSGAAKSSAAVEADSSGDSPAAAPEPAADKPAAAATAPAPAVAADEAPDSAATEAVPAEEAAPAAEAPATEDVAKD